MKNKIKIIPICTQYSLIEVCKDNIISKHIVCNNGWFPLKYWIEYYGNNIDNIIK